MCQELVAELDLLEKSTENTLGGCSWLLNLVNRAGKSLKLQIVLMQYPGDYWAGYFLLPLDTLTFQKFCQESKLQRKTKSKTGLQSF